jgi:type IV pilus assembly protein PilE
MKTHRGFTLIEMLITIAIIGILAGVALPMYNDYLTRGRLAEAYSELSSMRAKLEQFYLDNRTYSGACAAGTVAPLPTGKYFTYACTLAASTYTVTATGVSAQGTGGFAFTVNESNVRRTTAAPSGYHTSTTCWVTKKGETC